MSENSMEPRRDREVASECNANPELAELDRILANLDAEEDQYKIATGTTSTCATKPQAEEGVCASDPGATTVGSLPLSSPSPETHKRMIDAASNGSPYQRSAKLQAAVENILPSLGNAWRRQRAHEKLARSFQVAEAAGGVAFTLNLSSGLQNTLSTYSDPTRLMSHYINREFRLRLGNCPPYSFIFEVSRSGRLHLHGVLVPDRMDEERLDALDDALMAAGGRIEGARIVQHTQNYMDILSDGIGWFAYAQKSFGETARLLGTNKITFISTSLKRLCNRPNH